MKRRRPRRPVRRQRSASWQRENDGVDRDPLVLLAAVAEYRGVALIERPGDKRTVWEGREYFSDGQMYLMRRCDQADAAELIGLSTEALAKAFLDEQSQDELESYYSFTEMEEVIGVDERTRRVHAQLRWKWDEKQQAFVVVKGRVDLKCERGWGKTRPKPDTD